MEEMTAHGPQDEMTDQAPEGLLPTRHYFWLGLGLIVISLAWSFLALWATVNAGPPISPMIFGITALWIWLLARQVEQRWRAVRLHNAFVESPAGRATDVTGEEQTTPPQGRP